MRKAVLSINAGSSSIKFALFTLAGKGELERIFAGKIEDIGSSPHLIAHDAVGGVLLERRWADASLAHEAFFDELLSWAESRAGSYRLVGIGHRVVHGGVEFAGPELITKQVLDALTRLVPLAPLHQPHNLACILAAMIARPDIAQVACFDTAFHVTQPAVATRLAIPRELSHEGIRRYGFHGLSYEYLARTLERLDPGMAAGRTIAAHLGNGASLCAMAGGVSVDTTMGFTALDGLMMGTRCGSIDPGVILYLEQQKGMSPTEIQHLLYEESGLLGVSGLSGDMRELLASEVRSAREAVELFVYRVGREAGVLSADWTVSFSRAVSGKTARLFEASFASALPGSALILTPRPMLPARPRSAPLPAG